MKLMIGYEISTGTYKEDLLDFNIIQMINARRQKGLCCDFFDLETRIKVKDMASLIASIKKKTKIDLPHSVHTKMNAEFFGEDIIIALMPNYDLKTLRIDAYGSPEQIALYKGIFQKAYPTRKGEIKMSWYYSSGRGFDSTDLPIEDMDNKVRDSHYPFITGGVNAYLESYHKSGNSILLLTGEPGTGKTSFIRYYLNTWELDSIVTYDEQVMQRDDFYINFLTNPAKNVLIVEDADLLLAAREDGENKIMSKFLNVSDGLVKAMDKKIIFSTNITQLDRIDSAVIRPGRCFDVLEFRKLNLDEANVICEENELPILTEDKEYSLADIFNRNPRHMKVRKTGFI
jgi:hypothetical protein